MSKQSLEVVVPIDSGVLQGSSQVAVQGTSNKFNSVGLGFCLS